MSNEQCRLITLEAYQEYKQLATKNRLLGQQLAEAEEVIKFYSNADQLTEEEKQMTGEKYHLVYGLKANDYLEKWSAKDEKRNY